MAELILDSRVGNVEHFKSAASSLRLPVADDPVCLVGEVAVVRRRVVGDQVDVVQEVLNIHLFRLVLQKPRNAGIPAK